MPHTCHATGCMVPVPREQFMCRTHWFRLPVQMRQRIWEAYRPGQCDDWKISHAYAEAARSAVCYLALREGRAPDVRLYDALDPGKPGRPPQTDAPE